MEDSDVLELIKLLGPTDPTNQYEPLTEDAFDDLMKELADPDEWERHQEIIEDDLFEFVDNPTMPSALDKMNMLERLEGNAKFYDQWLGENRICVRILRLCRQRFWRC